MSKLINKFISIKDKMLLGKIKNKGLFGQVS